MSDLAQIRHILKKHKDKLLLTYGIKELGIFGSFVRGNQKPESDIDILIDLERPVKIDLIKFIEAQNYLSKLLNRNVDLVIKSDLKKRIGRHVLSEVEMI